MALGELIMIRCSSTWAEFLQLLQLPSSSSLLMLQQQPAMAAKASRIIRFILRHLQRIDQQLRIAPMAMEAAAAGLELLIILIDPWQLIIVRGSAPIACSSTTDRSRMARFSAMEAS
jgi:hypothetical protein